jgi:oligosaccharide translocation protein RFT1
MSSKSISRPATGAKKPPLSNSSAVGAVLLIVQQSGSRAVTFIVNQVLLRFLSGPELLGISTQLEVYSITVLFFARESLRVAVQRQADIKDPVLRKDDEKRVPEGEVDGTTAAGRTQAIVNLAYVSIALGTVLSVVVMWLYLSATDAAVLKTPYFHEALVLYGASAILELFAEPCYVVVQQKSDFKIRAEAESIATVFRCLMTCGSAIAASYLGLDLGVLPFALGQAMYAAELLFVYYFRVWDIASLGGFSLLAKKIHSRCAHPNHKLRGFY